MNIRTVKCPNCNLAATCESANYIGVSRDDIAQFKNIKNVDLKVTSLHHVTKRPFYHAVHYPGISAALNNIEELPGKYPAENWISGFNSPYRLENHPDSVVRCDSCKYLSTYEIDWPNDAYFQIYFKGRSLWAYDRETALKLLKYIESIDRKKSISDLDDTHVVQDYFLRKLPEIFQTSKARPEISKKLRKLLGMPSCKLN